MLQAGILKCWDKTFPPNLVRHLEPLKATEQRGLWSGLSSKKKNLAEVYGIDWSQTRQGQEDQSGGLYGDPDKQKVRAGQWNQSWGARGEGKHRTQRTRNQKKREDRLWRVARRLSRTTGVPSTKNRRSGKVGLVCQM